MACLYSFDAEVAQFLRACFEMVDVRNGIPSYSAVWAIMKVCILPLMVVQSRLHGHTCRTRKWPHYHRTRRAQGVYNGRAGRRNKATASRWLYGSWAPYVRTLFKTDRG